MSPSSSRRHPALGIVLSVPVFLAAFLLSSHIPLAQQTLHLNPMIARLAQGQPVFGTSTADLSLENARSVVRSGVESVRIEMEHAPMNFDTLRTFLVGMIDKAEILKKGNAQLNVAPLARFAPYGRERAEWVSKMALDVGLMGVIFNGIDNKEEALAAVRGMRYPQRRGSRILEPAGLRGYGPTNATWFWGIGSDEYLQRADLWPLNPQGDLLAIMMIETAEGVKNADAIASVPGVGVIFPGVGMDISLSLGVAPDAPETEAALQQILKACLAHKVACGLVANAGNIQQRLKEGWRYLEVGGSNGGLTAAGEATLRAGRAAAK